MAQLVSDNVPSAHRVPNADLWALVAFLQKLHDVDPARYRQERTAKAAPAQPKVCTQVEATFPLAPNPARGRTAFAQHACIGCHGVPGVTGPDTHVGAPLAGIAAQVVIAYRLPNNEQSMPSWLRDPHSADPQTPMPDLRVGEAAARDMAAHLATLLRHALTRRPRPNSTRSITVP